MKIQLNYIQGFKQFVKVEQHKLTQQPQQLCSSVILATRANSVFQPLRAFLCVSEGSPTRCFIAPTMFLKCDGSR